jgi:cytochrome b561
MMFASAFLVLLFARFWYMRTRNASALPAAAPKRIRIASQIVHLGMYFCLAMIPLTGLGIGGLYWSGIQAGDWMAGLLLAHEIFANTVLFLICAHIAAAFYHRKCRDGVWNSMVPFLREPRE